MTCVETKYGWIKDITFDEYYPTGNIKRCVVRQKNEINLACGALFPQYQDDAERKRLSKSLAFYENGSLEKIILQDITPIATKLGSIPAEMVSFYENGAIRRIFPSFGTISAFWTEEDEKIFSPEISLDFPFGTFHGKVINFMFYKTGELRSVTLWPKDSLMIDTPAGILETRIGFSLYLDGKIRSLEPRAPVQVKTLIGVVPAYDPDAIGIDGDKNSLCFARDGSVESLLTSGASVTVMRNQQRVGKYEPSSRKSDYFGGTFALEPMKISFNGNCVHFGKRKNEKTTEYSTEECEFLIEPFSGEGFRNTCEECDG